MREDHDDLRNRRLPPTYAPPMPPAPRSMRYILRVQHNQFLLPPGLGVQDAAALAYMLGQSRRVESRYPGEAGHMDWVILENDRPDIALSIIDPKDVNDSATANP